MVWYGMATQLSGIDSALGLLLLRFHRRECSIHCAYNSNLSSGLWELLDCLVAMSDFNFSVMLFWAFFLILEYVLLFNILLRLLQKLKASFRPTTGTRFSVISKWQVSFMLCIFVHCFVHQHYGIL